MLWVAGIVLLLISVLLLFYQRKVGESLMLELEQLGGMQNRNVEYEFVLRALKVVVWHIDCETRTISYDNDYRNKSDSHTLSAGSPIEELLQMVASTDRERITKALEDIIAGRTEELYETCQIVLPYTGKTYWTEYRGMVAARNVEGLPRFIVGTSLRIDDRKRMETELIEARNRAEESDRLKSAFIANMSHEIRTPLNAIVGFSSLITSPDMDITPEKRAEMGELIRSNGSILTKLINDILDLSRIESGKISFNFVEDDIVNICKNILTTAKHNSKNEEIEYQLDIQVDSLSMSTDPDRLKQVLTNLLSNAGKCTESGFITLCLKVDEENRMAIFSVTDTGCGIPKEKAETIFERFEKLSESRQGTGLGLAICRTIVEKFNGKIWVDTSYTGGARFVFTHSLDLPLGGG